MTKKKTLSTLIIAFGFLLHMLPVQVNVQDSYPEDGWWWDAEAPGRGYFIERQKGHIFVAAFIYSGYGRGRLHTRSIVCVL